MATWQVASPSVYCMNLGGICAAQKWLDPEDMSHARNWENAADIRKAFCFLLECDNFIEMVTNSVVLSQQRSLRILLFLNHIITWWARLKSCPYVA